MAETVGGFGVPHNPHFPLWVADGAPAAAEIERLYGGVAAHLRAARPDLLLVFTADHYNMFFETCVPIFAIGVAESAAGASDYPQLPRRVVPIAAGLARHLHAHTVRAGFDVGISQELELDHTVIALLAFLFPDDVPPIVPVFVNGLIPPLPSAQRCLAFGRAIAADGAPAAADRGPRERQLLARDRRAADQRDLAHGVPAPEWVDRVVGLLGAADVDRLVAEATEERLAEAGNAGGELLEWIAMLGTIPPARPAFLDVQPEFGHAYAAWPAP
jgi:Catalytic LigB subunit of aromatic ring-opening dioxygenase